MANKNKKERNSGIIIGTLNLISAFIMKVLCGGFFAKLFTSYGALEKKAKEGFFFGAFSGRPEGRKNSIRRKLLKSFDESLIMNLFRKGIRCLRGWKLNVYGTYFITFGIYSVAVLVARTLAEGGEISGAWFISEHLWIGILIALSSIPLICSSRSLNSLVSESVFFRSVLEDGAGISEDKFEDIPTVKSRGVYFLAMILGIATAALTYFVSPLKIVFALLFATLACIFLNFPEVGVVTTIFVAPFLGFFEYPSRTLSLMVCITAVSYALKLIVGKRSFKLRIVDAAVGLFTVLMFVGGIITSGGEASLSSALMYSSLMLMYFLVVNLMSAKEWLGRCRLAIAVPSGIIAAIGIAGYATMSMPSGWIDSDAFAGIGSRAVSTFDNPNMLATYLVLTAPFIWSYLFRKDVSGSGRLIAFFGSVATVACTLLTWSRGGWLGMLVAILIFLFINYRYTLKYIFLAGVSAPLWLPLMPDNVTNRFISIGNLTDSSTYYRVYTWKGTFRMLKEYFAGGIGVGESAFSQIYPLYAYMGTEGTMHSHNLFLELTVELGIMGLVVFLIGAFLIYQRGFGCVKQNPENKAAKRATAAAIAGFTGAMVHGCVDYVWYNYRVFFIFWVVAAFVGACADAYPEKIRVSDYNYKDSTDKEASLDIIFGTKNDADI